MEGVRSGSAVVLIRVAVFMAFISAAGSITLLPGFDQVHYQVILGLLLGAIVSYAAGIIFNVRLLRVFPLLFSAGLYLFPTVLSGFDYVLDDIEETLLVELEIVAYSLGWVALSVFLVLTAVAEGE